MQEPETRFSLAEIDKRLDELRLTEDVIELRREVDALLDVAKAAQAVVVETLMCPAGHLDALELALSKFEEAP